MRGIGAGLRVDTDSPVVFRSIKDDNFMRGKTTLRVDELYIGSGNLAFRQPASPWALGAVVDSNKQS